jgi:cysteine desulfurase / selenocysteine lyase
VDGVSSREVQQQLAATSINTSVSAAGSARFDLPRRGLPDLVRASVHYYNNDTELDRLIGALPAARPRCG